MAKIKFGMMMTDARGKLGGQVFSKNRSGSYVRTKVTPVNPRSVYQQGNRSLLGSLSQAWASLDEYQRNQWNNAVSSWQKTNVFGDLQKPTGKNLFTSLNKVRAQMFPLLDTLVTPPAKAEFLPFVIVSSVASVTTGTILTLGGSGSTNATFSVRVTPPLSPSISYVQNQLRSIGKAVDSGAEGVLNISAGYISRMGTFAAGLAITIEVRQVSVNGELGTPQLFKIVTTA